MDPTAIFNWGVLGCNCLLFLFLGLLLMLWALSPRAEGNYKERPQRTRVEPQRHVPPAPARPAKPVVAAPLRPAARPATEVSRQPSAPAATPGPESSALAEVLAEAQRAVQAISDVHVSFPTVPEQTIRVEMPEVKEAAAGEPTRPQAAEAASVTGSEKTYEGLPALAEAGARAAVERAAERVEQAVPAAKPVTERVKVAAREAPSPLSAPTLAQGIELILEDVIRREAEPVRQRIRVEPSGEGGVKIVVDDRVYFSVAEMPEGRSKRLLQQAVRRWNEMWQSQQSSGRQAGKR